MSNDQDDIPVANIGSHKPPPSPLDNPDTLEKMKTESTDKENNESEAKQFDESKVKGVPTISEFFTGFETRYPEYEVITPQTLLEITVRSMKVQDEEAVKGSMVNRRQTPELVNKAIWSTLVNNPFTDYDDFLEKTTILDREALLYAVYHVTYKDIQNYELTCQNQACGKSYGIKIELDKIFKMDAWKGEKNEVLNKRFEVPLDSVPDTVAIVKQPTLLDEKEMLADMLFQSDKTIDLGIEMLIVDKFIHNAEGRSPFIIEKRSDVFKAYTNMLPIDRKRINNTYLEQFGKYRIDLSMSSFCKHCGEENESGLDLLGQFFRALYG
jgi:hypothetical protein